MIIYCVYIYIYFRYNKYYEWTNIIQCIAYRITYNRYTRYNRHVYVYIYYVRVCSSPCLTWWKMNIYSPHVLIYSDDQLGCRLFFCFYQHVRKHMFRTFRTHSATVALIHPHFFQGLLKRILWRTPLTRSRRFAPASASVDRFAITGGTRWSLQLWVGSSIPSSMHVYIYIHTITAINEP